jgi:hypothetical protein
MQMVALEENRKATEANFVGPDLCLDAAVYPVRGPNITGPRECQAISPSLRNVMTIAKHLIRF